MKRSYFLCVLIPIHFLNGSEPAECNLLCQFNKNTRHISNISYRVGGALVAGGVLYYSYCRFWRTKKPEQPKINVRKLHADYNKTHRKVESMSSSLETVEAKVGIIETQVRKSNGKIDQLQDTVDEHGRTLTFVRQEVLKVRESVQVVDGKVDTATKRLEEINGKLCALTGQVQETTAHVTSLRTSLTDLESVVKNLNKTAATKDDLAKLASLEDLARATKIILHEIKETNQPGQVKDSKSIVSGLSNLSALIRNKANAFINFFSSDKDPESKDAVKEEIQDEETTTNEGEDQPS